MPEGLKARILLIDDEKGLVDTIKQFLEIREYSVTAAYDGRSGLETAKREKPDLIVLDIKMPGMDGRDVLSALKRDDSTKDIPVLMLTAKTEQSDRDCAMELGAYEYLAKPYDSSLLLHQIENILRKKHGHQL